MIFVIHAQFVSVEILRNYLCQINMVTSDHHVGEIQTNTKVMSIGCLELRASIVLYKV
jgi:hypothetical protein